MRRTSLHRSHAFAPLGWLALGASLGVAGLTLFDPQRGAARRAMLRDKAVSNARQLGRTVRGRLAAARMRARGKLHELRARFREREVADDVLEQRVRSRLGHAVTQPHALHVKALDGCIEVSGPIPASELASLRDALRDVRGVKGVFEQLDVQEGDGSAPPLQ